MRLEMHLEKKSQENDEYLKIYDLWKVIKNNATDILDNVSVYFPHFSLHNESHSKTICLQVERLLGDDRISKLSVTDTFMLLFVFYMHDVGMALRYEEIYMFFQSKEFKSKILELVNCDDIDISRAARRLQLFNGIEKNNKITNHIYRNSLEVYNDVILIIENEFRGKHAERSSEYIRNRLNIPSNIGVRLINLAGEICRLHQENTENIMELPYKCNGIIDDYMHPRFIASMLCIGDLLDLDTDRFNEENLKTASPMPESSKLHMLKHMSIEHFLIEPSGIEIVSNSSSIEVYRIMRDWATWIKDICNYLAINWSQIAPEGFENAPYVRKCDLLVNGSSKWLQYADLKFSITNQKAFELLQGAGIYKNKFVCFREIIQNSIDATLLRLWDIESADKKLENSSDPLEFKNIIWDKYKIKVKLALDDDDNILVEVRDNGVGISVEDLQYISTIGNKKNTNKIKKINTMPEWLKPSGAFGMGIQSIFLLTNKFTIITRTISSLPIKITFESSSDKGYIIVEDYNEPFSHGSKLEFTIDNSKIELNDLYCSEYYYKTINKSYLILERINGIYNNIVHRGIPIDEMQKQLYDYIPVEMKIQNRYSNNEDIILKYDSIVEHISNNTEKYIIKNNNIFIQTYNSSTNCIVKISIIMKNNENHIYGRRESIYKHKLGNTIFYKNVLVNSVELGRFSMINTAINSDLDFSINILGGSAENILQLNRNYIKESFKADLRTLCEENFKQEICKLIEYLIKNKNNIGDNSIILYQFAKYYNFKALDFKNAYIEELRNIQFNNYYLNSGKEVLFDFEKLDNNSLYFIYDEVDKEHINDSNGIIEDLTSKTEYCVRLDYKKSKKGRHLLYHKAERMFIANIDSKYYKVIEAKCMQSNINGIACTKDKYAILDDFICAMFYNLRVIRSIKDFSILETSMTSRKTFDDYLNYENVIELPFENSIREEIKKELLENGHIVDARKRFLNRIIESNVFSTNIEFITDIKAKGDTTIKETYIELISKLLELIEDYGNVKYIQYVLEWCKKNPNFRDGFYNIILNNDYLTID